MPFDVVAPLDPGAGTRTLLIEPPHFAFGAAGRDFTLGREFLFNQGIRYAAVGFGLNGRNILEPLADGVFIANNKVVPPVPIALDALVDEEIIVQFTEALTTTAYGTSVLGPIERRYAYGVSQTSAVLLETLLGPYGPGLFDLTLLHIAVWRPYFAPGGVFDFLPDGSPEPVPFNPPTGVGRVMFIESEGDLIVGDSEFFRDAIGFPEYRVYEVAGAAHQSAPTNPLDHSMILRAMFVRGDSWVRWNVPPPASIQIAHDPTGTIDPVYGVATGIARDGDLNALGGIRLPAVAVGQAQFIASDFSIGPPLTIPGLVGNMVDLACAPPAGSDGPARFSNHGDYQSVFAAATALLHRTGFLLEADAERLKAVAAESSIGKPGTCP